MKSISFYHYSIICNCLFKRCNLFISLFLVLSKTSEIFQIFKLNDSFLYVSCYQVKICKAHSTLQTSLNVHLPIIQIGHCIFLLVLPIYTIVIQQFPYNIPFSTVPCYMCNDFTLCAFFYFIPPYKLLSDAVITQFLF